MNRIQKRMEDLAQRVSHDPDVSCLLGLGSMSELSRLDEYSDLDFFLIVKDTAKDKFLHDLTWLEVEDIHFCFQNTKDGYKVLFKDNIFAEFAVFTETEILSAHFSKGLVYYQNEDFDLAKIEPRNTPQEKTIDPAFHVNEALTNIYIGLKRDLRGEHSSATTFIQSYAYHLIIELFRFVFDEKSIHKDPYVYERRIEQRFPDAIFLIQEMRQGYLKNKASAKAMLDFLILHFKPNQNLIDACISML